VLVNIDDVLALRIRAAAEERAARALAQHHWALALGAQMLGRLAGDDRLPLGVEVHRRLAFGIAAAREELAALAGPADHFLAAVRTVDAGRRRFLAGGLAFDGLLLDVGALR